MSEDKRTFADPDLVEKLVDQGRETAGEYLHRVLSTCPDQRTMQLEVFKLRIMAFHILGTIVYNEVVHGDDIEERLGATMQGVMFEYELLKHDANRVLVNAGTPEDAGADAKKVIPLFDS